MKIALAVWNNRVSPVFDATGNLIVIEIKNGRELSRKSVGLKAKLPCHRAQELAELGVDRLICGAISEMYESMISLKGIKVLSFIAGDVDEVIESCLQNRLDQKYFSMPGCGRQCRRRRGRSPQKRGLI